MADRQIKYQVGFEIQKNGLNQLKKSLQQISKMKISDVMKINDMDTAKATSELIKIKTEADNVERALKEAFNAKLNTVNVQSFNNSLKNSGTSINQVYQAFKSAGVAGENAFRNLSTQVLSTNIQLKQSQTVLDRLSTTFANTIKWNAASAAINSVTRSIQQAWGFTKALDSSLNDIRIVTGKSAEQMQTFALQANQAAKALGKTTVDYTNASLIYAQQGLSDEEVAARTEITLKTANVTKQSTDAVSEELTAVWNGYKVTAEEAEQYVDRIAAVAATTASDLEELATGMSKVASAANSMGVGEAQLAAQLSTIISVTREAPETIGTSLKTIYARMTDIQAGLDEEGVTLGNYTGQMAEFGISVLDSNNKLRDMGEVFEEVGEKWNDFTRQQQVALAQVMAGQRQYSRLIALFDNFDKYTKALQTANNATGTLQEQQDIYMESMSAHLNQLKDSSEGLYQALLNPSSINPLIDALSGAVNLVKNFVQQLGGGVGLLEQLGSVAVLVFSRQISKGITETSMNLALSKVNAQQFAASLEAVKQWQGIPELDNVTQKLLKDRQLLVETSHLLSAEQFTGIQNLINNLTTASSALAELKAQQGALLDAANGVLKLSESYDTLEDLLNDTDGLDKVLLKLEQQQKQFKELQDQVIKYGNAVQATKQAVNKVGFTDQAKKLISDLKTYVTDYISKLSQLEQQGKLNGHEQQLKRIKNLLADIQNGKIDINTTEGVEHLKLLGFSAQTVVDQAKTGTHDVAKALRNQGAGAAEVLKSKVRETKQEVDDLNGNLETTEKQLQKSTKIEKITKFTGSVATLASTFGQIANLSKTIFSDDISTWDKFLRVVMSLGMSFSSLFMVTKNLSEIFPIAKKSIQENTGAIVTQTVAAETGEKANEGFAASLGFNPTVLAVVAGLTALVAIISVYTSAAEEAKKKTEEYRQAMAEEAKEQEEQSEKTVKALNDLEQKFKDGGIARSQLKDNIDQLVEKYGLEKSVINQLTGSYDNLTEAVRQARIEQLKYQQTYYKGEKTKSDKQLSQTFNRVGRYKEKSNGGTQIDLSDLNNVGIEILNSDQDFNLITMPIELRQAILESEDQKIREIITKQATDFKIDADASTKDIIYFYDEFNKILQKAAAKGNTEVLQSSAYKNIQTFVSSLKQSVEKSKENADNATKAQQERLGQQLQRDAENFIQQIQTETDYLKNRDTLKKKYEEIGVTDSLKAAEEYLSKYHKQSYEQYNEATKYIDEIQKKFRPIYDKKTTDAVKNYLGDLDPTYLNLIESMDFTSWEDLKTTLEQISKIDFSNIDINGALNPEAAYEKASTQYEVYTGLQQQLSRSTTKSISKKEFEGLDTEIQKFFTPMVNGTYKLTGDAEKFYNLVNNLSLQGFKNNLQDLEESNKRLENYGHVGYENLKTTASPLSLSNVFQPNALIEFDITRVNQQLDYLKETGYELEKINIWEALTKDGKAQLSTLQQIAQAVGDVGNKTQELADKNDLAYYQNAYAIASTAENIKELNQIYNQMYADLAQNGEISTTGLEKSAAAFAQAFLDLEDARKFEGLDLDEVEEYAEYLQDIADQSEILADNLSDGAAKQIAAVVMNMNKAIDTLADNWENWSGILKTSSSQSKEYKEALKGTTQALSDLMNVNAAYIEKDFIIQHFEDITLAATGSEEAILRLKEAYAEPIIANVQLKVKNLLEEGNINNKNSILRGITANIETLQSLIPNLEVGAEVDEKRYIQMANNIIKTAKLTTQEANELFAAIGYKPKYKKETVNVDKVVPTTTHSTTLLPYTEGQTTDRDGNVHPYRIPNWKETVTTSTSVVTGTQDIIAVSGDGSEPEIESLEVIDSPKTSSLPSMQNYSSVNKGGGSPGSSGGSKSSGGSTKKTTEPKINTNKKELKDEKEYKDNIKIEKDIYHNINLELEKIARALSRIQKQESKLYGKDLIKNLNLQLRGLERQKQVLEEKLQLQKKDAEEQRKALKVQGVQFNKQGDIVNFSQVKSNNSIKINEAIGAENAETVKLNNLIKERNKYVEEVYNKPLVEDEKKKAEERVKEYDEQIKAQEKALKVAQDHTKEVEKAGKELEDNMKTYEELIKDTESINDEMTDIVNKEIEISIQKWNMGITIRLELGQAERDWNEFRRKVLNPTSILKSTPFENILADANLDLDNLTSYYKIGNSMGEVQALTNQLNGVMREINAINSSGWSDIYGDNKQQAMQDLQNYKKQLMSALQGVQELKDAIDQLYLDTIDDITDQFDKQIQDYEYVGELINHDIDLLTLLYGDRNYAAMDRYYDTLEQNNLNQIESLKMQSQFWETRWQEALEKGEIEAAKKMEQNYRNVISKLNETISNAAETIQNKYINAINQIFDTLDKKLSGGAGTDYISMEWDLMRKNADEYLDTINSAFAIQQTQRKYQQAIDDTKNVKQQQALKKLMDQQVENLRNKEKLTQYDVDRAEKLLQVEQARLALEDARAAKTSMRLKRDSQGNYSYVYTADQEQIEDMQSQLSSALNDLYNFDKENYMQNLDDMLAAWKDFQSQYKEILLDTSLSEEERLDRLKLLREQYAEYIDNKAKENHVLMVNLGQSAAMAFQNLYKNDADNFRQFNLDKTNNFSQFISNNKALFEQYLNGSAEDFVKFINNNETNFQNFMNSIVPMWDSGIQQMSNTIVGQGGFLPACQQAFEDIKTATIDFENELDNMATTAGIDLTKVKDGVDEVAKKFQETIEKNDALLKKLESQYTAVDNLKTKVNELTKAFQAASDAAENALNKANELQKKQKDAAAAAAEQQFYNNMSTPLGNAGSNAVDLVTNVQDSTKSALDKFKSMLNTPTSSSSNNSKNTNSSTSSSGNSNKSISGNDINTLVKGIAVNIEMTGSWENGLGRKANINAAFGNDFGPTIYKLVQDQINSWKQYGGTKSMPENVNYKNYGKNTINAAKWLKEIRGYATGGYTGDWEGTNGKLAFLHQKELVLNKQDTKNILDTVSIMRSIMSSIGGMMVNKLSNLNTNFNSQSAAINNNTKNEIEQTVHIDATFPNVNSKQQIEEAFNDLINLAAQRAMRK